MFRRGFVLSYSRHMSGAEVELHVELDGDEIVVTKPGRTSWLPSPEISEFRAHAFHAAVSKARELGWIV